MELQDHPDIKRIQKEVAEANERELLQRSLDQQTAAQLRQEQGAYLRQQFDAAVHKYEEQRLALHSLLGDIFRSQLDYQRVTGHPPPTYQENTFSEINLPTLLPTANWPCGFSTTRAATMAFFSNGGKWS